MPQLVISFLTGKLDKERTFLWHVADSDAHVENPYLLPNHQCIAEYFRGRYIAPHVMAEMFPTDLRFSNPDEPLWEELSQQALPMGEVEMQKLANLLGYPISVYVAPYSHLKFKGDEEHQSPRFLYRVAPQSQPTPTAA